MAVLLKIYRMSTIEQQLTHIATASLPRVLMINHGIGGGVTRHINELIEVLHGRGHVLLLEPMADRSMLRLTVPVLNPTCAPVVDLSATISVAYRWPQDAGLLWSLLHWLGVSRVHIHHALGWAADFWPQLQQQGWHYDLTLHDHSIFTGHPSLVNHKGVFEPRWLGQDLADLPQGDAVLACSLQSLATQAQRIIVPSSQLFQALHTLLPEVALHASLLHRVHPDGEYVKAYPQPCLPFLQEPAPLRVLCLGMLSIEKGAGVLAQVAQQAQALAAPLEFVLLGSCHVPLPSNVRRLGSYEDAQVHSLLNDIEPHVIWLPAQCPETWSYTLSVAFKAGLPVLTSDVGVFPERMQGRPLSWLCPHNSSIEDWLAQLLHIRAVHITRQPVVFWSWRAPAEFYLNTASAHLDQAYWLAPAVPAVSMLPVAVAASLVQAQRRALQSTALWRRWLLSALAVLRDSPWFLPLVNLIPYTWQQKIKRSITRAPLSERRHR